MKKILLSLFCLLLFSGIFAQSFSLKDTNGVVINSGGTIQFLGDPSTETIYALLHFTNNSAEVKNVKVKKVIHEGDTLTGTTNTFCWVLCWSETTYESPSAMTVQPGETIKDFSGDYSPKGIPGKSWITYVFFDVEDRNDSVAVVVEFNASPASVGDDLISGVKFSAAYPNPAVNIVYADYTLPESVANASIVITNMLGSKVKDVKLEERSGKARIVVSDLINGIYFYSLVADNHVLVTRKFVVKR
jgi:hypothetical protein